MAESVPRLGRHLLEQRQGRARTRLERVARGGLTAALATLAVASVAVHPHFSAWASTQAEIRDEILRHVPVEDVFITNWQATRKFFSEPDLKFKPIRPNLISPEDVPGLVERYGRVFIVLLDRSDSARWRQDMKINAEFMAALGPTPDLLVDRRISKTERLRIWQIGRTASSSRPPRPAAAGTGG